MDLTQAAQAHAEWNKSAFDAKTIEETLKALGANDIVVFVGGVIPAQDYDALFAAGAAAQAAPAGIDEAPCPR